MDNEYIKQVDDATTTASPSETESRLVCSWMRESNIDWIIQGPACAVLIINLIFLVRIMWVSWSEHFMGIVRKLYGAIL